MFSFLFQATFKPMAEVAQLQLLMGAGFRAQRPTAI
jgi:hypothetical protein